MLLPHTSVPSAQPGPAAFAASTFLPEGGAPLGAPCKTSLTRALAAVEVPFSVITALPREKWERVDPDVLAALGEKITTLSAELNAASYQLLALIAEFDRLEGWKAEGFASCAAWLAHRTRLDKRTAREKVRVAKALTELPKTSAAMAEGRLSFSQVRALTRGVDAETEEEALGYAAEMSGDELEKLMRHWGRLGKDDEEKMEARLHRSRTLSIFSDDEGGYVIHGRLEPDAALRIMRGIEAASDVLYQGSVPETTPEQRRADALALLVERAMAAGFEEGGSAEPPSVGGGPGSAEPLSVSTFAERYLVVLHVSEGTLSGASTGSATSARHPLEPKAVPHLEDGTRVSAKTARRLSCDAGVVRVQHKRGGRVVEVEGKRRTVPPRMRRALEVRDRGCRFPGCGSRFTEPHHITHWAQGGPTTMNNLVLLCRQHHRLLHEGGFRMEADPRRPGRPDFYDPRGYRIPEVPPEMTIDGRPVGRAGAGEAVGEREAAGKGEAVSGTPPRFRPPRWEEDVPLAFYLRALDAIGR